MKALTTKVKQYFQTIGGGIGEYEINELSGEYECENCGWKTFDNVIVCERCGK